jgi:hypothetical protein
MFQKESNNLQQKPLKEGSSLIPLELCQIENTASKPSMNPRVKITVNINQETDSQNNWKLTFQEYIFFATA